MEYSFPFWDILKDIHQINSGYPGYSHEYSFFILNISLVILNNHMNIHFWFWISLLEKEYSCLFLDIPDAPESGALTRRCRAAAPIASLCCPSATFPGSCLCFQQWLASISRHLCKKKKVFTKCAARVAEGAPPRHSPRKCSAAAVVARADPTSQVQLTCLPSRRKTCRGSQTFNPDHSNLVSGFRQTSLSMPGVLPW